MLTTYHYTSPSSTVEVLPTSYYLPLLTTYYLLLTTYYLPLVEALSVDPTAAAASPEVVPLSTHINATLYSLLSETRDDAPWPVGPGGLSTNGYFGNGFWDNELWVALAHLLLSTATTYYYHVYTDSVYT